MIKSIRLSNWKSHQESFLEFEKGTNVLIGMAGAGKSSVMDAICFALYGTFPALNSKKVSLDEVLMSKPNKADKAEIALEFNYKGKEFKLMREINRKGANQAKLIEGSKTIAGPKPSEVNSKIIELLGIDFDLFSRAIYSEQNNLDYFLRLTPSERKKKFDELLQINKYEEIRANSGTLMNRLRKNIEEREKIIESQKKSVNEKEITEIRKRIEEKEKKKKELGIEKKTKEKEFAELKGALKECEKNEKQFREFSDAIKTLEGKAGQMEKELKKTREKTKELTKKGIEKEISGLKEKIIESGKERAKMKKDASEFEEKAYKKLKETSELKAKKKQLSEALERLSNAKTECPVCKSELKEKTKKELESHYLKEIRELGKGHELLEKEALELKKEKNSLEKKIDSLHDLEKKSAERKKEFESLLEETESLQEKEKELEELKGKKKEIETVIKSIDFDEKKMLELRDKTFSLKEKINSIEKEFFSAEELINEMLKREKELNEFLKQVKLLEEKNCNAREMNEKLSLFSNALKQTQCELRNALIDSINEAMDALWPRIYPYRDFISAKIIANENDYEIMVKNRENEFVRVEGILSGGERTAVAITLRVAFSLVLAKNLSWIILDEPTHNLDSNSIKELTEILRNHLPSIVEQVFVITHEKEMEKAATGKTYLLSRNKELFEATNSAELMN